MDIAHLEEFIYLADTLSFSETAKHFYTSRSVISRRLASLENELGVQLFERSRQGATLTEAGEVFSREASVLVKDYERAVAMTRQAASSERGSLDIGYLRNAARPFIITFVNGLKERNPSIPLTFTCMDYDELCQAMQDGQIDAALSMDFDSRLGSMCQSTFVYKDEFYAVVGDENPLAAKREGLCRADLAGKELIVSESFASSAFANYLNDKLGGLDPAPSIVYTDDFDEMQLRLRTGSSIALRSGLNLAQSGEGIVALPFEDVDFGFGVSVFVARSASKEVALACKRIATECKRQIEQGWANA